MARADRGDNQTNGKSNYREKSDGRARSPATTRQNNSFTGSDAKARNRFFHKAHIQQAGIARSQGEMKAINGFRPNDGHVLDSTTAAMQRMQLYCSAHPGSPSAARRPRLFTRSHLWVALLGPSVEEGIVGIGQTVEGALRAFDAQYLAGLRPPSRALRRGLYDSKLTAA